MWTFSHMFFRSPTFNDAITMYRNLGFSNFEYLYDCGLPALEFQFAIFLLGLLMLVEIIQEHYQNLYNWFIQTPTIIRWSVYFLMTFSTIMLGSYGVEYTENTFIYFQF